MKVSILAAALVVGAACAPAPRSQAPAAQPCGRPPAGDPSMVTVRPGAATGPQISAPRTCAGGTVIAVHGRGTRPIRFGATTCPAHPTRPDDCVFADGLGRAIAARRPEISMGIGLGACHAPDQPPSFALIVHDWGEADEVISAIAEELEAQQVGGSVGVSIQPIQCVIPLGSS